MEPNRIVFYFVCICVAFVVKGLAGFGDPLISTPLLSLRLPNSVITPGLAPVSLILNANMVWKNRGHFSAKIVLPISVFVLLGIIPGTLLLKFGSPQWLKLLLGLLIIGLGVEMLTRKHNENAKPNIYLRAIASFFSGLTAGLFGINLLFLAYMERVATNREESLKNGIVVYTDGSKTGIGAYVANGKVVSKQYNEISPQVVECLVVLEVLKTFLEPLNIVSDLLH